MNDIQLGSMLGQHYPDIP